MINEQRFRLKKNGEPVKNSCYCRHPELIENYDKAITDTTQVWDCHHRLECCFTQKFMKDMGLYYDVEPEALIFLTRAEHHEMNSMRKRQSEAQKNRKDQSKKVLCVESGEVFPSAMEAYRKTGIHQGCISMVCNGERKTAGGFHWRLYENA